MSHLVVGFPVFWLYKRSVSFANLAGKPLRLLLPLLKKHCFISNPTKQHILDNSTYKISEKDIIRMHFLFTVPFLHV